MASTVPSQLYYVSDKAYNHLAYIAMCQGYIKTGAIRQKGMSEFLDDLAYMSFTDTRPLIIKERHQQELEVGRAPRWSSYNVRRTRSIRLPDPAIERYMKLALQVGIIKKDPWLVAGPSRTRPTSVLGFVFEGLGLGWITPVKLPIKRKAIE